MRSCTRPGLTLIETVIGLFLTSIITAALLNVSTVINRSVESGDRLIDEDLITNVVRQRMEEDISGAFAPLYPEKIKEKTKEEKAAEAKAQEEKQPADIGKKPGDAPAKKEPEKQAPKPLKKIFDTSFKEGNLKEFTFITTSTLAVYPEAKNSVVSPRLVRVTYRLISDGKKPESFRLMRRQEDPYAKEESSKKKSAPEYELVDNLKSMSFEFRVPKEAKKGDDKSKEGKTKSVEFKKSTQWHSDEQLAQEKPQPPLPQIVTVEYELWNNDRTKSNKQRFEALIYAFAPAPLPVEKPTEPLKAPGPSQPAQTPPVAIGAAVQKTDAAKKAAQEREKKLLDLLAKGGKNNEKKDVDLSSLFVAVRTDGGPVQLAAVIEKRKAS